MFTGTALSEVSFWSTVVILTKFINVKVFFMTLCINVKTTEACLVCYMYQLQHYTVS